MATIIDLSVPTEDSPSEPLPVRVGHEDHRQSVEAMKSFFGCTEQDMPQGLGWANDSVTMGAHAGTHVDAPWHYFPTSEGEKEPGLSTRCPWSGFMVMGWYWT